MIDLHSHVLPGLDDGVADLAEAVELARAAAEAGVTAMAATPHVRADYPTTAAQMEAGVREVRAALAEAGVAVEILCGGELDVEFAAHLGDEELRRFTIAQNGRHLLVETPYRGWPLAFDGFVEGLLGRGFVPILAHPERNRQVQERPQRLEAFVAAGALVQLTTASVDGRLGRGSRRAARELVDARLAHLLATDAHGPQVRAHGVEDAVAALGSDELARYLTEEAPAAVVAGADPGPPPQARRRRLRPW